MRHGPLGSLLLLPCLVLLPTGAVRADDWVVARLRGQVSAFDNGGWQPLERGSVVDDHRRIRSADGSHVVFTRDKESLELTGATEIRIYDRAGERMTTILQAYGTVAIEAEHLNVQHFSVQTPYLAAVVKGTKFTVTSNDQGSQVAVSQGMVQVQDTVHDVVANVIQGQDASVSETEILGISGVGRIPPLASMAGRILAEDEIVIIGNRAKGKKPDTPGQSGASHGKAGSANSGNGNSGNGNSGNGNGNSGNNNSAIGKGNSSSDEKSKVGNSGTGRS